jgi:hypothetical protein
MLVHKEYPMMRHMAVYVTVGCVLLVLVGCDSREPAGGDQKAAPAENQGEDGPGIAVSWGCPKVREVDEAFGMIVNEPEPEDLVERSYSYARAVERLETLLKSRFSTCELRQLAALPSPPDNLIPRYRGAFLDALFAIFLDCGDEDGLVKFLSIRCPETIGPHENVEFVLALRAKKLEDPILILGRAYDACKSPNVRHDIAAAVRRGFSASGVSGKDDSDLVKNAMQWYRRNRDHLTINVRYGCRLADTLKEYEPAALFVLAEK